MSTPLDTAEELANRLRGHTLCPLCNRHYGVPDPQNPSSLSCDYCRLATRVDELERCVTELKLLIQKMVFTSDQLGSQLNSYPLSGLSGGKGVTP